MLFIIIHQIVYTLNKILIKIIYHKNYITKSLLSYVIPKGLALGTLIVPVLSSFKFQLLSRIKYNIKLRIIST